jgi:hypothetical protein
MPAALFRCNPEVQDQRKERNAADAHEPKAYKPQQAMDERALRLLRRHQ